MEKTKLLVIAITTAAIAAAATATSLSAATPAFARINCNEDLTVCTGGQSNKQVGIDIPGGGGGILVRDPVNPLEQTFSGGQGENDGTFVGGLGFHQTCDASGCTPPAGSGLHEKGPGGNSGNAPPP